MSDSPPPQLSIIIPLGPGETEQKYLLTDLANSGLHSEIIQSSEQTRASSLNAGAKQAKGQWLWFLHADSRVSQDNLRALKTSRDQDPHSTALHYFDLGFKHSGHLLSANALGANIRSRLLGCPYGEDLLFVWRAHRATVPMQRIPSTLFTSGRKYHNQGWLKVTLMNQWYWLRLSLPQMFKLVSQRWRRS